MSKRLVIAEKPSVARDVAAALGGFTEHEEYLESDEYVVTWAIGHLLELAEPQEYDKKWGSWSIKNLPILPDEFQIQPREGQKKRLDMIKKLGTRKDVTGMINACDAGREGELIYRRIVEYCGLDKKPQERLWLQSMTKDAIRHAFDHLKSGKELDSLGDAAWLRAVGDWLVGMNATRAITQRMKSRGERDPWSAGRVQTPTLFLLVARERQILAHIPRPYWEIVGKFHHGEQDWESRFWDPESKAAKSEDDDEEADPEAKPSRLFDKARVDRLMLALAKAKIGEAAEKRKKSKQNPPLLFDLTLLQREANRKFSFSAKRTLDAAQRLYEQHKVLTYPRTDSRYLPADYGEKVVEILGLLGRSTDWRDLTNDIAKAPQNLDKLLDGTKVSDHFAIIPTGVLPEGQMRPDDERIFELVVRQFLGALMGPATWSNVERIVSVPAGSETARFRSTSRTLEDPGFLRAIGIPNEANPLPPLLKGQDNATGVNCDVVEVREEEKETRPPGRYSEAQLLRMMETAGESIDSEELSDVMKGRGLGTPATRADTIEGLVRKGYSRRIDNRLGPTSKAMRLMDILERVQVGALASPKMTGEWEFALEQVQAGKLSKKKVLERLTTFTRDVTASLTGFEHADLYAKEPDLGTCPSCGKGQVIESTWGYRCTKNDGEGAECDFMIWKDRAGRYIDRDLARTLVRDGKAGPIHGFVDRSGRSLSGDIRLERDPERENRWALKIAYGGAAGAGDLGPEVVGGVVAKCPMHEGCDIVETNRRYVCRQVLDGTLPKGPLLPKIVCQREMTIEEALPFFGPESRTELIEGFTSKRGRPFRGWLVRKETGRYGFEFPARGGDVDGKPVPAPERPMPGRGRGKGAKDGDKAAKGAKSGKGKGAKAAGKGAKAAGKGAKATAETTKSAGKGAKATAETTKSAGKGAKATAATAKSAGKGAKVTAATTKSAGKGAKATAATAKSAGKGAKAKATGAKSAGKAAVSKAATTKSAGKGAVGKAKAGKGARGKATDEAAAS